LNGAELPSRLGARANMKKPTAHLRPLIAISKAMPTSIDVLEESLDAWAKQRAQENGNPVR